MGSAIYREKEDRRKRYPDAVGVDMQEGGGVDRCSTSGSACRKARHVRARRVRERAEHSRRPWLLAANLERLMEPEATIFVSVPFIWRFHGYRRTSGASPPEALPVIFPNVEWSARMLASDAAEEVPGPSAEAGTTIRISPARKRSVSEFAGEGPGHGPRRRGELLSAGAAGRADRRHGAARWLKLRTVST